MNKIIVLIAVMIPVSLSAAEKSTIYSEQEYKLFCAVREIANTTLEIIDQHNKRTLITYDARDSNTKPWYKQTKQGLFLEEYNSVPCALLTPWGRYNFLYSPPLTGLDLTKELAKKILLRKIQSDEKRNVYECLALGVDPLPAPQTHADKDSYTVSGIAAWKAMTRQYEHENPCPAIERHARKKIMSKL